VSRRLAPRPTIWRALIGLPLALAALGITAATALGHNDHPPVPSFPSVGLAWTFDPLPIIGVALAAAAYLWAERRVAQRHQATPVPRHRRWLFMGGLAAILIALLSPVDTYEGVLFSVHMVQHILLEMVAAPLIVLSAPITLVLRASGPSARRRILTVLHSPPARWITLPVVTWFLFAGVNWGWHFSGLYNVALQNDVVHYLEHASFLAAALLFWWPAIGPDPQPWRIPHAVRLMYLFLAMPQNSFLGVALLSTERVLYLHYVTVVRTWGPAPLDDQHLGGTIMWVFGDIIFLTAMLGVVWAWMRFEDARTARLDARLDRQDRERRDDLDPRDNLDRREDLDRRALSRSRDG
jgi:cytochrome c oxidase assembly factor CtaG